jgi:Fe-S-cluster containining protein
MKLKVIESEPWYSDGLSFTCAQCGNCCSGGPGYVWVTDDEVTKLANHLGISRETFTRKYCRRVAGQYALKEIKNTRCGEYDCVFMKEITPEGGSHRKRICTVYEARPLQCRTWPFWEGNLSSAVAWKRAARSCLGMNHGEFFDRKTIEALRDAKQWPKKSPTSALE